MAKVQKGYWSNSVSQGNKIGFKNNLLTKKITKETYMLAEQSK